MASQVCETLAFINDDDGVRGMEVLEINGALLMSLMEESPSEESDNDRLDSLIRSFEAEISGNKIMGCHDSASTELMSNIEEDTQLWNIGEMDGQDYWASSCEFEVEFVDMDLMPSSPCDDGSWFIDPFDDEKNNGMANNLMVYDGFAMGEHGYNSLWQENYEMCH
ncbi:uncharacterized protein LOC133297118 [Gastrolobium bilobum]|uniref:uncharacterized protein LOC133297118 n=1 Tax=Gastrolobium bilobum TaxID=150636 RepID=UPI002AAFB860|nr:uncharacterized protein LOC133297118 [Gastrolobium bilobum]